MMKQGTGNPFNIIVLVAALGYFVDIYDLILFNVVKVASLTALGYSGEELERTGLMLFNWQMTGMLLGGIIWGIMGDKKGRVKVLFGSIIMYSLANIANGFVTDIYSYAIIRFIAGVGLAGELGAGITLVSETMNKENRGYGTMLIVTFGALGAVLAALIADSFDWKTAYFVGGGMGLLLLVLRVGIFESGMFAQTKSAGVSRGNMMDLFTNKHRFRKYLYCILIGLPIWYVIGVLIALSNKFAVINNVEGTVKVGTSIMFAYIGLSVGDLLCGVISQMIRSRKKVVIGYLIVSLLLIFIFLFSKGLSEFSFNALCFLLGAATGYWALFVTIASEQFGTNLRSTVTTTVPNFVRGAVVPITLSFKALESSIGSISGAVIVGVVCVVLAFIAILNVDETFGKDLNYTEIS
jgi:MFS transporter, putative metabolite:H+ symporter